MPGADPVTTGLETAPLVVLFLVSIVLLRFADRRAAKREAAEADNRALRSRMHGGPSMDPIVGSSGGLSDVMERVTQVAVPDAPAASHGEFT